MAKFSTSFILVFLVVISGNFLYNQKVDAAKCDYLEEIGGGCPDQYACLETCRPCYRNIGRVSVTCVAPGGGIPYWRCRCVFSNGAPCPPVGPPACPKPPSADLLDYQNMTNVQPQAIANHNQTFVMEPMLTIP